MKYLFWLVAGTLGGLAHGMWLPSGLLHRAPSPWTILNLHRTCNVADTSCKYHLLTLSETQHTSSCFVTVESPAASTASLAQAPCVSVSSLSMELSAMVIVADGRVHIYLTDGVRGAAFDVGQAVLASHPDRLEDKGVLQRGEKRKAVETLQRVEESKSIEPLQRRDGNKTVTALEQAGAWSVLNASRFYNSDFKVVVVEFTLYTQDYDSLHCVVVAPVPDDADWKTYSFYSQKCSLGVPWHVSWGYNPRRDSGVMTVINPEGTRAAWFGWDNVNSNPKLQDVGPNDTQEVTPSQLQTEAGEGGKKGTGA